MLINILCRIDCNNNASNNFASNFHRNTDIHTVTSLLKSYLRELPEPVVPFDRYDRLIDAAKVIQNVRNNESCDSNYEDAVDVIREELDELPKSNYNLIR